MNRKRLRERLLFAYSLMMMIDNLKLENMIIAFLIFLSFCFGFFVAGLMAEGKRNDETE